MQEIQFDYFHGMEAEQYTFYRIPKILFTAECFKTISCEAKVLYLSLIHISEPTRQAEISYAVFCLKKKKNKHSYTLKTCPQHTKNNTN